MGAMLNLWEYEKAAQQKLPALVWDYCAGGSADEDTLRANRAALAAVQLRPRVLVDVSQCNLTTTVLGQPVALPILVAPMGLQALVHPEGESGMARAAAALNTVMVASAMANTRLEEIASHTAGTLWFQLYVFRNRAVSEGLVRRAEAAGYQALVLTVDLPRMGRRERDLRNGFSLPPGLRLANFDESVGDGNQRINQIQHSPDDPAGEPTAEPPTSAGQSALAQHSAAHFDDSLTWKDLRWLRRLTKLPILLKGILTAEDARLALEHGMDGVIVSNHGGRQLDGAISTMEALPEVVDAVEGRVEVYMDGGIRRGRDVFVALALGARAVLIGRPLLWGLAVDGAAGASHVLQLLRDELELTLCLAGCPEISHINRTFIKLP